MANANRRDTCPEGHKMDPNWGKCPYCEAEQRALKKRGEPQIRHGHSEKSYGQSSSKNRLILEGRYEIVKLLGEGSSASVFRARDNAIDRDIVLKAFNTGPGAPSIARIQREVKLYGRVDHPLITKLYDVFVDNGRPYLVLSYEPGMPLDTILGPKKIGIFQAYKYACDILEGLAYLHSVRIVHRDIKPSNILVLEEKDHAVISDLGIGLPIDVMSNDVKVTQLNEIIGTPAYMAVELMDNKTATFASDVYSAGVVFFEMLTGQLPFSANNIFAYVDKARSEPTPQIDSIRTAVPKLLNDLVNEMLSKEPAHRPTAEEAFKSLHSKENVDWGKIDTEDSQFAAGQAETEPKRKSPILSTRVMDKPEVEAVGFFADELRVQMVQEKHSAEIFERRSKVWLEILGRESVATILGGILLLILILAEISAFLLSRPLPEQITNILLIIVGYFFGQTASRVSKKGS